MSTEKTPWANVPQRWGNPWHSMCSYLGSFPASLCRYFICLLTQEGDIVYDPFSGRGTTLLETRLTNRMPLASDLNPISIALTRAKNVIVKREEVYRRIEELENKFDLVTYIPEAMMQPDEISLIYHQHSLAKLCYLKKHLLNSSKEVDIFLTGVVLGIMHGNERSDGTSAYASISMPNTFSMSPGYVRKYVQNNRLNRVDRDIFVILKDKVKRLFEKEGIFQTTGVVTYADAKDLSSNETLSHYKGKVDLILTSPPYLGVINYAKQNWIRLWFLNKTVEAVDETLDDNLTLSMSIDFLEIVILEFKKILKQNGVAVVVLGDVAKSKNSIISPARELIRRVYDKKIFNYIGCISDRININDKTTRIWKETKGKATAVDRIIILSDHKPILNNEVYRCFLNNEDNPIKISTYDFTVDELEQKALAFAGIT